MCHAAHRDLTSTRSPSQSSHCGCCCSSGSLSTKHPYAAWLVKLTHCATGETTCTMQFMPSNLHVNLTTVVPTEESWAESVGMQGCDGAAMSRPHSFGLGHFPRHYICRVDSDVSVMGCSTTASHSTLVAVHRLHLHHRWEQSLICLADC